MVEGLTHPSPAAAKAQQGARDEAEAPSDWCSFFLLRHFVRGTGVRPGSVMTRPAAGLAALLVIGCPWVAGGCLARVRDGAGWSSGSSSGS
jgi:hypothetical protein